MIAMRTILISCIFMLALLGALQAQELEHFTVKKYIDTYQFHPKFKKEVNANYGFWQFSSEYYKYFKKELRDSIAQLPEDAVKHFTETRLCTHLSFDKNGNITRDPAAILETHQVLPIGYWKGSGLSLVLDLIASCLAGGTFTRGIGELPYETELSQLFIAFSLSNLPDRARLEDEIGKTLADLDASTPVKEGNSVHYPGEGMKKTREESMRIGVFADDTLWAKVKEL